MCVCVCVCVCVRACACACVRLCLRACLRARVKTGCRLLRVLQEWQSAMGRKHHREAGKPIASIEIEGYEQAKLVFIECPVPAKQGLNL